MIRIALEITCKKSIANNLQFESLNGKTLKRKSRKIIPNLWKYQALEVKTMVGNSLPEQLNMSTSVFRWVMRDLVKNTKFLFRSLARTSRFEIQIEDLSDLPIKISSDAEKHKVWVSRHSLWVGIKPTDLEYTLEEERLKNPLQYSAMVRYAELLTNSSAIQYEMHERKNLTLQHIPESDSETEKFRVEAEVLTDAEILHGRSVIIGNQILQLSNRRSILLKRSPGFIDEVNGSFKSFKLFEPKVDIESGLYIGTSSNWFHFIVESAVRIGSVPKEIYFGKPVIIENGAHKNILRLCRLMTGVDPIQVAVGQSIQVTKLTLLREFGVNDPIDPVQRTQELRNFAAIINAEVVQNTLQQPSKLFFRRPPNLYRPLQNEREVADFLESKGFKSVYPEQYDLDDFIVLLRGADFVVAESGAAITNLMFARPSTKFLELTPALVPPEFWRTFIEVFGQEYFSIHGDVSRFGAKGYAYDGYKVSIADVKKILNRWGFI